MEIDLSLVKKLRERTQVGFVECKKALSECDGDFEGAIALLRKKSAASGISREGRETNEGSVAVLISNNVAVIVELLCETDFVARNSEFIKLLRIASQEFLKLSVAGSQDFSVVEMVFSPEYDCTIGEELKRIAGVIKENINFGRTKIFRIKHGVIGKYVHPLMGGVEDSLVRGPDDMLMIGKRAGVVAIECSPSIDKKLIEPIAEKMAIHVCGRKPKAMTRDGLDQEFVSREEEIIRAQIEAGDSSKTMVADKIVAGKMKSFFSEIVLLEQPIDSDGFSGSMQEYMKFLSLKMNGSVEIVDFASYHCG